MKIPAHWSLSILLLIALVTACQQGTKRDVVQKNLVPATPDSSLWLKETRGIRDILQDNEGNLWFSSPDYVARYNGRDIRYFTGKNGLPVSGNLHKDSRGTLWVENGFRAFKYNGEGFSEEGIDGIRGSGTLWIQKGLNPTDTVYVAPGVYEATPEATTFHPYPVPADMGNKYLYFPTTKATYGRDSTVWLGTMEKVFGFRDSSFVAVGRDEMGRQDDERNMGIRGIFIDHEGRLWMADNGAGLFVFDGETTENFTQKHHLDYAEGSENTLHRAFSIAEDTTGKMWFGTVYSGIWRYDPDTETFEQFTSEDGVNSDTIWTIYRTREGDLLFAGESPAAVYRFNGKSFDRVF